MDYVKMTGKKDGKTITAVIQRENGKLSVADAPGAEFELEYALSKTVFVGGTYPAPDDSLLKAYYVLVDFFDKVTDEEIAGEIEEIPQEEGVVY